MLLIVQNLQKRLRGCSMSSDKDTLKILFVAHVRQRQYRKRSTSQLCGEYAINKNIMHIHSFWRRTHELSYSGNVWNAFQQLKGNSSACYKNSSNPTMPESKETFHVHCKLVTGCLEVLSFPIKFGSTSAFCRLIGMVDRYLCFLAFPVRN